ncbi:hypothetical protein EI94DRAFT_1790704 [Lactarius quietus]|nr:hypothetical protein EI94DRAFT_1790704 [Lactarius quietus]
MAGVPYVVPFSMFLDISIHGALVGRSEDVYAFQTGTTVVCIADILELPVASAEVERMVAPEAAEEDDLAVRVIAARVRAASSMPSCRTAMMRFCLRSEVRFLGPKINSEDDPRHDGGKPFSAARLLASSVSSSMYLIVQYSCSILFLWPWETKHDRNEGRINIKILVAKLGKAHGVYNNYESMEIIII